MNRRTFLGAGVSCAAHVWLAAAALPVRLRAAFGARPAAPIVAREPWGNLEQLSDGVWALISTPLAGGDDAMRTFSNGGIVAGRDGVLVVEGFASGAGARWMAEQAERLAGTRPTHVVLTHYHGDHSGGLAGYRDEEPPEYLTTEDTRARLQRSARERERWAPVAAALDGAHLVTGHAPHTIDLGGRRVIVTARAGHTASDLTVTVEDPRIVFCGDLLWNGLFPNYRDATPSVLSRHVAAMLQEPNARFVPGHGALPTPGELRRYSGLLDLVEETARRAHQAGVPAEAAAAEFRIPPSLGAWTLFSDSYFRVALAAWERELKGRD